MVALPDEIWYHIFAEFEDYMPLKNWRMYGAQAELNHQGPVVLRDLCLVCRQFQRIAQPLLYRTLLIEGRDGERDIQSMMMRTLIANPKIGEQVRAVSIDDRTLWWSIQKLSTPAFSPDDMTKLFLPALRYLDLPPPLTGRLRHALDRSGFAALGVAYMPHVQFVDSTIHDDYSPLPWMLSGILGVQEEFPFPSYQPSSTRASEGFCNDEGYTEDQEPQNSRIVYPKAFANYGFPNLTEVRIRTGSSDDGCTPAWVIEPLLLHPTLKILRTLGINWYGEELRKLKWPTHVNNNLECLDLTEAIIDAEGLKTVLIRCQGLRGLSIELPGSRRESWAGDFEDWEIDYDKFRNILLQHGQKLDEFDLHTAEHDADHSAGDGSLGSLRELTFLRHLKVQKETLLGPPWGDGPPALSFSEALPSSIETLHLYWRESCWISSWADSGRHEYNEEIQEFLIEDKMPNLRKISMERVHTEEKEYEWSDDLKVEGWDVKIVQERLGERCDSIGYMRNIVILTKNI
ncbi:hypothetical protein F53441_1748 [Fusarium austroafricanum]|uniref:F-box domain-containing protein n=1 Tax=Fusarium austroafricanum TaxID=2364996 RepID=A0A8H4KTM9_9HYPO|nr:hypothetical protein F53441_1748 [Fusarium austroafricanum]